METDFGDILFTVVASRYIRHDTPESYRLERTPLDEYRSRCTHQQRGAGQGIRESRNHLRDETMHRGHYEVGELRGTLESASRL